MSHFLTPSELEHLVKARNCLTGMIESETEDEYHDHCLWYQIHSIRGTSEVMERISPAEPIRSHD